MPARWRANISGHVQQAPEHRDLRLGLEFLEPDPLVPGGLTGRCRGLDGGGAGLGGSREEEAGADAQTMRTYLLRRLLTAVPVLIGISLVLFTILALAPGDPFGELATNPNVPPEVRMNLRKQFGLDDPVPIRYVRWFSSMLQGDWGFSFVSRVNVDDLILQRLPTTLFVLGSAQVLALLIAMPVGVCPHGGRTRCSTRSPRRWPSSASPCRPSSPGSSSSSSSASTSTGCRSSTGRTSGDRAPWLWENLKQGVMPITVLGLLGASSPVSCARRSSR